MTYNPQSEGNVPPEFLLNPKMMAQYINMMTSNIEFLQDKLIKLSDEKQHTQDKLDELSNKRQILENYLKFTEAKGFAVAAQQSEDYVHNTQESQKERFMGEIPYANTMSEGLNTIFCFESFWIGDGKHPCFKPKNHLGSCGP